jgi:amino-acid N-acetyltransferase
MSYKLIPADSPALRLQVISLLQRNELPATDLDNGKQLFALVDNDVVVGSGGLEIFHDVALLRSLSVNTALRGKGLGKVITKGLEQIARQKGIHSIFLLTTTAKDFFEKEHYVVVDRNDVPEPIKQTSEFSGLCPSTAIVMKKHFNLHEKVCC